jgi:hypothetical protein
MTEVSDDIIAEVLEHHGVLGMRWGHHKLQDTSSGNSRRAKPISEHKQKRAAQADADVAKAQKTIDAIKAKPKSRLFFVNNSRKDQIKQLEEHRDQRIKDAKDIRNGHMTDHEKHLLIGTAVTAGVLGAYGAYRLTDSGQARALLTKEEPFLKNEALSRKMSPEDILRNVVEPVNSEHYGELGTKVNCRRCTFAYEMRRRGYDVNATRTVTGSGQTAAGLLRVTDPKSDIPTGTYSTLFGIYKDTIKDPAHNPENSPIYKAALAASHPWGSNDIPFTGTGNVKEHVARDVFTALAKEPEGSRGELGIGYQVSGGHSLAYEIIDGKPHVFDNQTGTLHNEQSFASAFGGHLKAAGYTRLDNIELNEPFVRRWVKNV